ncbi:hypothetical protein EMPG_12758 [Blastomyces silverae]|uniref:Uncharacterized protein n=1 Tax=Blastomyces silverae TaxID=2060906 RepID=A0A0H1BLU4_9EURO|nr:hypothetical protein EMPG_12758 [Blastomyces silverae]
MMDSSSQRSYGFGASKSHPRVEAKADALGEDLPKHMVFLSGAWQLELNASCGGITDRIQYQILAATTESACQNSESLSNSSDSLELEFSFARTANMMTLWPAHRGP